MDQLLDLSPQVDASTASLCDTLSVNRNGRLALLASPKHVVLVQLAEHEAGQDDFVTVVERTLQNEPKTINESQFAYGSEALCALATGDVVELYDWSRPSNVWTNTLNGHSREVKDVSWHEGDRNLLASCGLDGYVHVWDLRAPAVPVSTFTSVNSQPALHRVCWERPYGRILAASEGHSVRLWDARRPGWESIKFRAHAHEILGMDFSTRVTGRLITSGEDHSVKFWDIDTECNVLAHRSLQHPSVPMIKMR